MVHSLRRASDRIFDTCWKTTGKFRESVRDDRSRRQLRPKCGAAPGWWWGQRLEWWLGQRLEWCLGQRLEWLGRAVPILFTSIARALAAASAEDAAHPPVPPPPLPPAQPPPPPAGALLQRAGTVRTEGRARPQGGASRRERPPLAAPAAACGSRQKERTSGNAGTAT
eukprot:gene18010-biopygen850